MWLTGSDSVSTRRYRLARATCSSMPLIGGARIAEVKQPPMRDLRFLHPSVPHLHRWRNPPRFLMAELREGLTSLIYRIKRDFDPLFRPPATSRLLPEPLPQAPRRRQPSLRDSALTVERLSSSGTGFPPT